MNFRTPELKRLRSGPIMSHLLRTFRDVIDGTMEPAERKMNMFSGHDTTISSFLNALGLFDPPIAPPYAACVMVELLKDKVRSGDDFVGQRFTETIIVTISPERQPLRPVSLPQRHSQ